MNDTHEREPAQEVLATREGKGMSDVALALRADRLLPELRARITDMVEQIQQLLAFIAQCEEIVDREEEEPKSTAFPYSPRFFQDCEEDDPTRGVEWLNSYFPSMDLLDKPSPYIESCLAERGSTLTRLKEEMQNVRRRISTIIPHCNYDRNFTRHPNAEEIRKFKAEPHGPNVVLGAAIELDSKLIDPDLVHERALMEEVGKLKRIYRELQKSGQRALAKCQQ